MLTAKGWEVLRTVEVGEGDEEDVEVVDGVEGDCRGRTGQRVLHALRVSIMPRAAPGAGSMQEARHNHGNRLARRLILE